MAGQHAQGHDTRRAILRALLLRKSTPNPGNERPERPFTGYKLAHAVLSADGTKAGFAGLTLGGDQVYGVTADATCVWTPRHAPPRRWCGCGFYCLHEISEARGLGCATENRSALLLEVVASGRYIRYERGLRYSRQRVRVIRDAWCSCGRPGVVLGDAGTGLVGWRHLAPFCSRCAVGRPSLTLQEFAAKLDGPVDIDPPTTGAGLSPLVSRFPVPDGDPVPGLMDPPTDSPSSSPSSPSTKVDESPIAVLTAEIALLHARLDDLQSRMER
ncbi:MAG TPA: hypothetical protein VMU95_09365 [Trebonia sp.]|nr:hypothetical protein [Trebonia sp.]